MSGTHDSEFEHINRVVIIPAFNEEDALPLLIVDLLPLLAETDAVVVVDDSAPAIAALTSQRCEVGAGERSQQLLVVSTGSRGGRGAAVRKGMSIAVQRFPRAQLFVECDADGSHQAVDIQKILASSNTSDVIIGSRYLADSQIIGWSLSRKLQSRVLNFLIPRILGLRIRDITNGLRRYNRQAIGCLLKQDAVSTTFIYLTEQALVLHRQGMQFHEVPIVFAERRAGYSSVTAKELRESLRGLARIIAFRRTVKSSHSLKS